MSLQPHPAWPFPTRHQTVSPLAEQVIADPSRTPEQVEAAMVAQGALIEHHVNAGRREPAREAAKVVKQLHAMRTPEAIAAMEQSRGLR